MGRPQSPCTAFVRNRQGPRMQVEKRRLYGKPGCMGQCLESTSSALQHFTFLSFPNSNLLLVFLWLGMSPACCSVPDDELIARSVFRDILGCLTRFSTVPGGMGVRPGVRSISGSGEGMDFVRSAHVAVGTAGCSSPAHAEALDTRETSGHLFDSRSLALSAGDWLAIFPSEVVQWHVDEGYTHGDNDVPVKQRRAPQQNLWAGGAEANEEVIFKMTRSGSYHVRIRPRSPVSRYPVFQLRVFVSAGYPSARTSKACYIAPPTSNDTHVDLSEDRLCSTLNASRMMSFEMTEGPSAYLEQTLIAEAEAMNITNISVAKLLIDREFPMCMARRCMTLQVRRYDSWGNPILSDQVTSIISVAIEGVTTSMYELVTRGKKTILSDGVVRKWETHQWIGLGGKSKLGNNTCNQFACNVTKLVGPETNIVAWVTVRMDGVPLGQGSPFRVSVTGGGFYGFQVDPSYNVGNTFSGGGAAIRLLPVDKVGNQVNGALSYDGNCNPNSFCARRIKAISDVGINVVSECYQTGALVKKLYTLDRKSIGPFRPDTSCTKRGCSDLLEFFYCDNKADLKCGADGTKPFKTGAAYEVSNRANDPPECDSCPFFNGEAIIAKVRSDLALSCLLNMTFNSTLVESPTRTQNTIATEFFGTYLGEGQSVLKFIAGEPNATTSTVRYPGSNETGREFKGSINVTTGAFELLVTLQDSWANPTGGLVGVFAELRHPQMILRLPSPKFNETTGAFHVIGNVTISGEYRLQLALEPFFTPIGGSPFLIMISGGEPVIPNTLLLKSPTQVTIGASGQFFFQPRDAFKNFVSSNHNFFDSKNYVGVSPATKAPGFWIWLVPVGVLDADTRTAVDPILDKSGYNILRCGADPDQCNGKDPGLQAFVAGFSPQHIGDFYLELQYCDPRVRIACIDDPFAYNHSAMKPPQAPNPCQVLPAGKGGARPGLACTLNRANFWIKVVPDRIAIVQSAIILDDLVPVGLPYTVQILPKDFRGRPSATPQTTCTYDLEYYERFTRGRCIYNAQGRSFSFIVQPNVTGTYWVTVYIDDYLMSSHPKKFTVSTSLSNYDPTKSTAIGSGLDAAAAGNLNTIYLFLRDFFGNVIPPEFHIPGDVIPPQSGYPFWRECGYNYAMLQDGTPTAGYGNPGNFRGGLEHGCKVGLHVYVVDWNGLPIRPARGFEVVKILPQPDGSVQFVYTIKEAGLHALYFRYINSDRAGWILHNISGYLSLNSMSRSREGQIHGSPFQLNVIAGEGSLQRTKVIGSGIIGGSVDSTDWARFDIAAHDSFGNPTLCAVNTVDVKVLDPIDVEIESEVRDADGNPYDDECHVFYRAKSVGTHRIDVMYRAFLVNGAPFHPTLTRGLADVVDWMTFARLVAFNTRFSCYWNVSQTDNERCRAMSKAGSPFAVRVSTRDTRGLLGSDDTTNFDIKIFTKETGLSSVYTTYRLFRGEHELELMLTSSGIYHISVLMTSRPIMFRPFKESAVEIIVSPAVTHAASCLITGSGLSITTAGIPASFSIIPRDRFGNRQVPTPSPDTERNAPGAGIFQVRVRGPMNSLKFAQVVEQSDGSFVATYNVTGMGQYLIGITMLDEVPTLLISSAAAVKKAYFRSQIEGSVETAPGRAVSNNRQPIVLQAEPNLPSTGSPCIDTLCCDKASRLRNIDLGSGPAVAGESFKIQLELIDICGNPTRGFGENVRIQVFGPLNRESKLLFERAPLAPGIPHLIARSNAINGLYRWQETLMLTASGEYGIAVSLSGRLVDQGATIVQVLPVDFTATELCVLDRNISIEPLPSFGFNFFIEAKDPYGNSRMTSLERFELNIYPIAGYTNGVFKMTSDVKYVSGGTYYASVSDLGTYGMHLLTIMHEGRHVHGSPFTINVVGGYMEADNTDLELYRVTQSTEVLIAEKVNALAIDDTLKMKFRGRDVNGAFTRLGMNTISLEVIHETRGDISPTSKQLDAARTQTLCTETNYGTYCNPAPAPGALPMFSYEALVDASNTAHYSFKYQHSARCWALSGYDSAEIVFNNVQEVRVSTETTTLGGPNGNETVNTTIVVIEYHPISFLNLTECEQKCAQFSCSCATYISDTGTYRDGTCIVLGKAYFLEYFGLLEFPGNFTKAIMTSAYKFNSWETIHYEEPLIFNAKSLVSGNMKVRVSIAGQEIRGSPVFLFYSPGLLGINQSDIVIQNANFQQICLRFDDLRCIAPAAGQEYTLVFTPKDTQRNVLIGSPPESQYRVRIQQGSERFQGLALNDGKYSVAFSFTPTVSGIFQIAVQQENTYGDVLRPFSTSLLEFPLKSSANTILGESIFLDRSACDSECTVTATVPNDAYNNPLDARYILQILELEMNAYIESGVLSNLVPSLRGNSSSQYQLLFTRSGQYVVGAYSIHGPTIPGSPLKIDVSPATLSPNSTLLSGPGIAEVTLYEKTFFDVHTRDQYGNLILCDLRNLTVTLSLNGRIITINSTSGNSIRKSCRSTYEVTSAGIYSLQVMFGENSFGKNITTQIPPGKVPFMHTSSATCYVITPRDSKTIALPCMTERLKSSIGDVVRVQVSERTEGEGLVGYNAVLFDIEGENATAPNVVKNPNYTRPQYPWILEMEQCDSFMFILTQGKVCNPVGDTLRSEMVASNNTLGEFVASRTLETTGIFSVVYLLPHKKYGQLETPWVVDVQAADTDLSKVQIYGTGLDLAIYSEESTFVLEDRDTFGNLRAGTDFVSFDVVRNFRFEFAISIVTSSSVDIHIRPEAQCFEGKCLLSGTYSIAYKVRLPSTCSFRNYMTCPDALRGDSAELKVLYKSNEILSRPVKVQVGFINYAPATALAQGLIGFKTLDTGQVPTLSAGQEYTLNVQPQDLYGNRALPSFEGLRTFIDKGNPEFVMGRADEGSIFTFTFKSTVGGTYSIRVFDGVTHIRGSPFNITVLPGPPNPQSCVISGTQAFITMVDVPNMISANLVDAFGNIVTQSKEALVRAFFSTWSGTPLLQIPGARQGAIEIIEFTITQPGNYKMQIQVGGFVVQQGAVITGSVKVPLKSEGHIIRVLARGTCAAQCQVYGQGLTIATAGISTTFFVVTKDEFGRLLEQRGEFFGIAVDGNQDERCSISTAQGYKGSCAFTKSGTYRIEIRFSGQVIADKRTHTLRVEPAETYHLASYLEQKSPKTYIDRFDGVLYQSTTNFDEGAFLGKVGYNSYTLVLNDRYGNRLTNPVPFSKTFCAPAPERKCFVRQGNVSKTHVVDFWVIRLQSSFSGKFMMWEEGTVVTITNASAAAPVENGDGLDENGEPIKPVVRPVVDELVMPFLDVPQQPHFNKSVSNNFDGSYSLAFRTTSAGKYRIQVYIDGFLIRRYIPLDEISQVQADMIKSELACCIPMDPLRKIPKDDGNCPSSGQSGKICGDLITLLPLDVDPKNSFITGNKTKQFRKLVDGDGEGNKAAPKFQVLTQDSYGNTLSAANFELLITIFDINGTVVLSNPMISIQPRPLEYNCRTTPPNAKCGMFEFEWNGLSAARSGKYLIDVTYNGISIGNNKVTTQIRSLGFDTKAAQVWGPGLQVAVIAQPTYFYFRVRDTLNNEWEPDAVDDKMPNVDFGGGADYFGVSYPGLDPVPKLQLDSKTFNPQTKMIYFGYGLFQIQMRAWPNSTLLSRGSIAIKVGESNLATLNSGIFFTPLILDGYDYYVETRERQRITELQERTLVRNDSTGLQAKTLVPNALQSFATGSGLYNHFAGDEIEVTVHAMTNYRDTGGSYFPSTKDVPGKQFVVDVRGPAGVRAQIFKPERGSTSIPWQFQAKWIPTVSGMYTISVTYDGEDVQGDSHTSFPLPKSPYYVQVYQAPAQPIFSTLSGSGLTSAVVGVIATFRVSTRDIFNNPITKSTYYSFRGDEFVNASLISSKGPAVLARTISLRDGSYRCEYMIPKSGDYSLLVMVNGVPVTNPPLRVSVTGLPDAKMTRWFLQRAGLNSEMCKFSSTLAANRTDEFGSYLNPGCVLGLLYAGDAVEAIVELNDAMNNTVEIPLTQEDVKLKLVVEGSSFVEKEAIPLGFSKFSAIAAITKSGTYMFSVWIGASLLPGSPYAISVSASVLSIPACFTTGDGLQRSTVLNRTRGLVIHGRDTFGNNQTLQNVELEFHVRNVDDSGVQAVTAVQLGFMLDLLYRIEVPGFFQVTVRIRDSDNCFQKVPLSDVVVRSFSVPSPQILTAQFTQYGDSILVQFDSATDTACMHGKIHDACLPESQYMYESCCFLFRIATCQVLGMIDPLHKAKCIWQSPYEMKIHLGFGASILPRDRLVLAGVIRSQTGYSNFIEGSVLLDPPAQAFYPMLSTAYFPMASLQQNVWIDASQTFGGAGRPFVYQWSVGPQFPSLHELLKLKPPTLDAIEFNSSLLGTGKTEITVRVLNFLKYASSEIISVERSINLPLRARVVEGSKIQMHRPQQLTLTGELQASSDFQYSELQLSWYQVSGPTLNFANVTVQNAVLSLPPFFLPPDSSVVLAFKAVAVIMTATVLNASTTRQVVSSETRVTIEVPSSALMANIAGPYGHVSKDSLLVWDATASFDPDFGGSLQSIGELEYIWSCNPVLSLDENFPWKTGAVSDLSCFYDYGGVFLQKRPLLNLTGLLPDTYFMCDKCLPGLFRINLNVSKTFLGNTRWAVASTVISFSGSSDKDLIAAIIPVPYSKINPAQRLFLDGYDALDPLTTLSKPEMQYEWSISNRMGCCLGNSNMTRTDLAKVFPGGMQRPFLIIKPGYLSPGLGYVFEFTIKNVVNGASSSSFLYLDVDDGPRGGKFLVSPPSGTMTQTIFMLECVDWMDEIENLPLKFLLEYEIPDVEYAVQILESTALPKVNFKFPDVSKVATKSAIYVKVTNNLGSMRQEQKSVLLQPSAIITLSQAKEFAMNQLGMDFFLDMASTDLKRIMERINIVSSVLNKISAASNTAEASRRALYSINSTDALRALSNSNSSSISSSYASKLQSEFNQIRSKIITALNQITANTTHTRFTVRAISSGMHLITLYPDEIFEPDFAGILATCEALMLQRKLFSDNHNASVPFAGILKNLLESSRLSSSMNASRFNLRNDEILVGKVIQIRNILSQAILDDKLPDEEFVFLQTSAFLINTRRVRSETAKSLIMGSNTVLESQTTELLGSSAYQITSDAIDFRGLRYKFDDGSWVFGTFPYPMTLYDTAEAFPKSILPSAYRALDIRLFQKSPPMTKKDDLTFFYLDFDITQWKFPLFESAERQRTELDWASVNFGRSISIICSSVFIDCSETNHICVPDPSDGSQGPSYPDTACNRAFDGDETTDWAVDPKAISDTTGAGSSVAIKFVRPFLMTMIKYKPRVGPKYCAESKGMPCEVSSDKCTCVIGGDREISFTFSDGSIQKIELAAQTYATQRFYLQPVMTDSVVVRVLSVYSNSKYCPKRTTCAWWQPSCVDWCPNGAALIEFLSTEPIVQTYDYNYSYMSNYSVSARVVSDVTSMEVRQYDHVMHLFALETPFKLNMTVRQGRRSGLHFNDDTIVVCRSFDDRIGRWSSRGTLLIGPVEDPAGMSGVHTCIIFFVSNFSLVLVEKPYESLPTFFANTSVWRLQENTPDSLVSSAGLSFLFFCYCILVVLRFKGWLKVWHQEEKAQRSRMNEYLISITNPAMRGKKTDDQPTIQPFYYPIVGLVNSRVVAAHSVVQKLLFSIHIHNSFARWHYLYTMITGHDEISRLARITSFYCLTMFSFAINSCTISGATINGHVSMIYTDDSSPSRWWFESVKSVLVIFPIAQVLPAVFRLISKRHEGFDRWEVSEVVSAKEKAKPKLVFGDLEKKSDLKSLRNTIGSSVVIDLLNPIVQEDKNAPRKPVPQEVTLTELAVKDDADRPGTLKHFVRQRIKADPTIIKDHENDSSLSLTGTVTTSDTSNTSSNVSGTGLSSEDTQVIRASASLPSKSTKPTIGQLRMQANLAKIAEAEAAKAKAELEVFELDENGEIKPHPPTPRVEDPPPVEPFGVPARRLTYRQEKYLLRQRWIKKRESDTVFFASPVRKMVFSMICGDGYSMWFRGQRPVDLLFFPSYFIYIAYAICFVWLVLCYIVCLAYTTGFDKDMAWAWHDFQKSSHALQTTTCELAKVSDLENSCRAQASMTTVVFECLFSQTLLGVCCAWWKHVDGRVTFYKALVKWCLFRSDLMPAMG